MNQLVELRLHVHNDGLRDEIPRSIRPIVLILVSHIPVVRPVVAPGQQRGLQAADVRIQIRGNLPVELEHMGIGDAFFSINLIAIGICGIGGVLRPEGGIEACLLVRENPHLKASGAFHEVHALYLHPHIAVDRLAVVDVRHLGQLIQQLVPGVPQVVGLLYAAGLNLPDSLVELQYLLSVGIDFVHLLLDLHVQVVLIGGQALVDGLGALNQLRAPLDKESLGHGTGGILGQLLHSRPEVLDGGLERLAVHLAQLSLHLFHDFGGHFIEHTAAGFPAVYFVKEIIPYMFYPGISDAQAHLFVVDGPDVY